jgi:hypothetical protein
MTRAVYRTSFEVTPFPKSATLCRRSVETQIKKIAKKDWI